MGEVWRLGWVFCYSRGDVPLTTLEEDIYRMMPVG